jgi:pimeloyl-ACP methyl ester carboxylesterase
MKDCRPPRLEGAFLLASGRQLGYAEYGPSTGRPLIWFHGTPGARRQIAPEAREIAHERGVRIIAVERPGIGASTPHLYDSFLDWAADIEEFCNALELSRFAIVGLSGGGPYALACAHEMPDRVVAVGVLGGVAPTVGPDAVSGGTSGLTRLFSPVFRYTRAPLGFLLRRLVIAAEPLADQAVDAFASLMPPGDKRVFENPATRRMFQDDILNGVRDHMQAILLDAVLFGRDWGFLLGDISVPIHMWYGDADNIVPVAHGQHMAERIPTAVLRIRPEEGHLGGLGASREIFDAVFSHWPDEAVATA